MLILLLSVVVTTSLTASKPAVVVDVPCDHLDAAQCMRFKALADAFLPALVGVEVIPVTAAVVGRCDGSDLPAMEACYDAKLTALPQPTGDHLGLKGGERAMVVLLFDPVMRGGSITGSYVFIGAGRNHSMSTFSLRPETIVRGNEPRDVWVVSGGMLADEAFRIGLLPARRQRNTPFPTGPASATHGDLLISRTEP